MITLFSQASPANRPTAAERDLRLFAESAAQAGARVCPLPVDLDGLDLADIVASYSPSPGPGLFSGYVGAMARYADLAAAAANHGVSLINSPEQSAAAMHFELAYPQISDLTARSYVIDTEQQCDAAIDVLGAPLFVKGSIKSEKERGWEACLAHDSNDLRKALAHWQRFPVLSHGKLVARQLLPLRTAGEVMGFPRAREVPGCASRRRARLWLLLGWR